MFWSLVCSFGWRPTRCEGSDGRKAELLVGQPFLLVLFLPLVNGA